MKVVAGITPNAHYYRVLSLDGEVKGLVNEVDTGHGYYQQYDSNDHHLIVTKYLPFILFFIRDNMIPEAVYWVCWYESGAYGVCHGII